jgi:hypothetical protein
MGIGKPRRLLWSTISRRTATVVRKRACQHSGRSALYLVMVMTKKTNRDIATTFRMPGS